MRRLIRNTVSLTVDTTEVRFELAHRLDRLARRVSPLWAERQEERETQLVALGEYAYGNSAWTSVRTMIGAALKKAAHEGTAEWEGRRRARP